MTIVDGDVLGRRTFGGYVVDIVWIIAGAAFFLGSGGLVRLFDALREDLRK